MKEINLFILIVFFASCSVDQESSEQKVNDYVELTPEKYDAVQVNNQISSIQKGTLAIVDSVFKADTAAIEQTLEDAVFELDVSINRLKSLGDSHNMANYFSTAVIELLVFYKNEFEVNFLDLLPILKKKNLTVNDQKFLSNYDEEFVDQEAILFEEIIVRQDSFAKFFQIGLTN